MFQKVNLNDLAKKNRVAILICSIVAFIIGVLSIIAPFAFGAILIWIMIGLVGVLGICLIVKFIVPTTGERRDPLLLIGGILLVLSVTAIILIGVLGKSQIIQGETWSSMEIMTVRLLGFSSIFFGVFSVVNNIFLLCNIGNIETESKGLLIFRGILGIIIGVLMSVFPFFMFGISMIIGGVYLMVLSIATFIFIVKNWKLLK